MYQVTAPITARQLSLINQYERIERFVARTGFIGPATSRRRAALVAEIEQIEQEKKLRVAA